MSLRPEKICLVVPCYNEAKRLALDKFLPWCNEIVFVFVSDGSSDGTVALLEKHAPGNYEVLALPENKGKAEAVRAGILHARELPACKNIEWFGFWDADLATPLEELPNFLKYRDFFAPDASALFGSRIDRRGAKIDRSFLRHLTARMLITLLEFLCGPHTYDSQCGAKIFQREVLGKAFARPFATSWLFDIEIVLRLGATKIVEVPLQEWRDISGSKVLTARGLRRVARDIFTLWRHYPRK